MSNTISDFLQQHPLLLNYARKGLINLNALSKYIKDNDPEADDSNSLAAIGMNLRRYLSKNPSSSTASIDFQKYSLQVVSRSNIQELILNKDTSNRSYCMDIIAKIAKTKSFISLVEGEKEMVLMTDYPLNELVQKTNLTNLREGLGFISINFPIELRLQPGIYSIITSSLAEINISIHSFHTIGGEILILVKDEDLTRTQEVLRKLLNK